MPRAIAPLAGLLLGPALAFGMAGCKRQGDVDQAPEIGALSQGEREAAFQRELEGVWATDHSSGDDAEEVYVLAWDEDALQVVFDQRWLPGKVEDVDFDNRTVAFHIGREDGPSETLTLRRMPVADKPAAFTLDVTWGNGQSSALGFVRRLTDRDRAMVAQAREEALRTASESNVPWPEACATQPYPTLRLEMACSDKEIAYAEYRLAFRLGVIRGNHPDAEKTAAAAHKQLDACKTQQCVRDGYQSWEDYLDENFDLPPEVE